MNYWSLSLLFLLLACDLNSEVNTTPTVPTLEDPPTRRALFRKQYELKEIHLITQKSKTDYSELWKSMTGEIGRGLIPKFSTDDKWEKEDLSTKVIFLIGTWKDHEVIKQFQKEMPFSFQEKNLTFAQKEFQDPSNIIRISLFPNPLNPTIPMYLLSGNTDEEIIKFIKGQYQNNWRNFVRSSFGYQVYEKGKCQLTGFFSESTWEIDKLLHWDFTNTQTDKLVSKHFEFIDHRNADLTKTTHLDLVKISNACESNCKVIADFFGKEITSKVRYHIYENMERKGLMTYNTAQSHMVPEKKEIHVTHSEAYLDNNPQIENHFFLKELLGEAAQPWLANGTSIFFAKKWQRYGFKHWSKKLLSTGNLPAIIDIVNPELVGLESPIVLGAGQAALVDFLVNIWGRKKFAGNYGQWKPTEVQLQALEADFHQHILSYDLINIKPRHRKNNYLQGFNFAHEGYQIYNGYGSTLSQRSLKEMNQIGANSIALVPYSYMRDPNQPTSIPIVDGAGSETDESLIHSIQHAKAFGMSTVMKPQLWLGRSWTGFIEMKNQDDWDSFFKNYYRWIRHFALLSEIYEVDVFSVGVEFVQATLQNEAAWKQMFEKIRPLFSGELTYCANWGDEFEKLSFWEPLDFIGINCYYPISDKTTPSQRELNQNFAEISKNIAGVAKQYKKQIVFTEIGFRSVKETWKHPHAQADGRTFDYQAQSMAYEAVFKNIENAEWCDGILWWKWPSYLGHGEPENTRFSPVGKPAEKVIEKWFENVKN